MARLAIVAPVPPSRSPAATAGAALVRLLRRSAVGRGHAVRAVWPVPESVEAILRKVDLPVYLLADDPEERDIFRAAVEQPGLVVLHDTDLHRVVNALVRARDPVGIVARREAEAAVDAEPLAAWCAHAVRRARGAVVADDGVRAALQRLGCKTPLFAAAPLDEADDAGPYERAVEATLSLLLDPAEWAMGRWASALLDCGIDAATLAEGYGLRYAEALEELRSSPAGAA